MTETTCHNLTENIIYQLINKLKNKRYIWWYNFREEKWKSRKTYENIFPQFQVAFRIKIFKFMMIQFCRQKLKANNLDNFIFWKHAF